MLTLMSTLKIKIKEEHLPLALSDVEKDEGTPDDQENEEPEQLPTAPCHLNGRMQGQLPTATEVLQNNYRSIKQKALA
jgi:hypothetical protein